MDSSLFEFSLGPRQNRSNVLFCNPDLSASPKRVDSGNDGEGQNGRCYHAADHWRGNSLHHIGASTVRPHDGKEARYDRGSCHNHRTNPLDGSLDNRLEEISGTYHLTFL